MISLSSCFVYEAVVKISSICFHNFFESVTSVYQYGTRQANKDNIFLTQKGINQCGCRSEYYCGDKCWNEIPLDIKRSPSANIFLKNVETYLFVNNYKCWLQLDYNYVERFHAILQVNKLMTSYNYIS